MRRPEASGALLGGVSETLLVPLYFRAQESRRSDAILRDARAAAIVEELDHDFSKIERIRTSEGNKVARFMLTREIDRRVRAFLEAHPDAVVVEIGCGLDARFERVDDGRVEWFDLDLPEVIELRRRLVGGEGERHHLLACSAFDPSWHEAVGALGPRPVLFVAEAVLVYFAEAQVRSLVEGLCGRFPGSELIFDAWSPALVPLGNVQLAPAGLAAPLRWAFWRARRLEGWAGGPRLLGQWGFFDEPEPRLAPYRWVAPLFHVYQPIRLLHYRLGGEGPEAPARGSPLSVWLAVAAAYAVVLVLLLVVGHDASWWQAWALSILVWVAGVGGRALADRRHPGLQADRMRFGAGQDVLPWDRALSPLMAITLLYVPAIVAALDHRFGWTGALPLAANLAGLLICALGYGFAVWALVENRFFASVVRIQTERGHRVCDTGPYRFVRHPGYAGNLLAVLGLPLVLGSWWTFLPAAVAIGIAVVRTALEDRLLSEELEGYREYARRVRYRLLVGVW